MAHKRGTTIVNNTKRESNARTQNKGENKLMLKPKASLVHLYSSKRSSFPAKKNTNTVSSGQLENARKQMTTRNIGANASRVWRSKGYVKTFHLKNKTRDENAKKTSQLPDGDQAIEDKFFMLIKQRVRSPATLSPAPKLQSQDIEISSEEQPCAFILENVVPDYSKYKYAYYHRKPFLLGDGAFARVFLVQKDGKDYSLKAYRRGNSSLFDVSGEAVQLIKANTHKCGPKFRGFFPISREDVVYEPWALLTDVIYGQTLLDFAGENCKALPANDNKVADHVWVELFLDVVQQIARLNKAGIVLYDISGSNVMVSLESSGNIKAHLIDFGNSGTFLHFCDINAAPEDVQCVRKLMQHFNFLTKHDFFEKSIKFMRRRTVTWDSVIEALTEECFNRKVAEQMHKLG